MPGPLRVQRVDLDFAEPRREPGDVLPQDLEPGDGTVEEGAAHGLGNRRMQ